MGRRKPVKGTPATRYRGNDTTWSWERERKKGAKGWLSNANKHLHRPPQREGKHLYPRRRHRSSIFGTPATTCQTGPGRFSCCAKRRVAQFSKMAVPASPASEACPGGDDWSTSYWQLRHRIKVVGRAAKDGMTAMPWMPDASVTTRQKGPTIKQWRVCDLPPGNHQTWPRDGKIRDAVEAPGEMDACKLQDLVHQWPYREVDVLPTRRTDGLTRLRGTTVLEGCHPIGLNEVNDIRASGICKSAGSPSGGRFCCFCAEWLERQPGHKSLGRWHLTTGRQTLKR
jgi:hypothetical protein